MKLSFSLKAKEKPVGVAPSLKKSTAFSSFDDGEHIDAAVTSSDSRGTAPNKKLIAQNVESSKAMKKRMEAERMVDETVYDYDGVYEKMQEAKLRQKEAKEADAKQRKASSTIKLIFSKILIAMNPQPKYISGLLATAATRKLDHLRAEEKMMQREREMEGDEFADKEAFVTQAYKDQMAEVRRAEEEEKKIDCLSPLLICHISPIHILQRQRIRTVMACLRAWPIFTENSLKILSSSTRRLWQPQWQHSQSQQSVHRVQP